VMTSTWTRPKPCRLGGRVPKERCVGAELEVKASSLERVGTDRGEELRGWLAPEMTAAVEKGFT
jgi:hypothetical protein